MNETQGKKAASGWLSVVIDYGPLLVFLLVYRFNAPADPNPAGEVFAIVYGTGAFMIAAIVALIASRALLGKISPMLWFSTALIVGFGGFTIWTGDERIIQLKPTILYAFFGVALLTGWRLGRPLLKFLLEAAFEGLTDEGWLKLSRNWGLFFLVLAALNEVLVWQLSFGAWLSAKLWVFLPLTFLFTFANIPMLLKHGLSLEGDASKDEGPTGA